MDEFTPEERAELAFQKAYDLSLEDLRNGLRLEPLVEGEVFVAHFADSCGNWEPTTLVLLTDEEVVVSAKDPETDEIVAQKVTA